MTTQQGGAGGGARSREDWVERVRAATDIVDLIGQSVRLRKAGHNMVGLCPFHKEKTPSFSVHPGRQFYHCFSCKAGGDVFKYVQETEKVGFLEAAELLSRRAGIAVPERSGAAPGEPGRRGRVIEALDLAARAYEQWLADPVRGAEARAYLERRGVAPETVRSFRLGLAPAGWENLSQRLAPRLGAEVLIEAGLSVPRASESAGGGARGGIYDRFRNRLMVPLVATGGTVVGFGARALAEDEPPKYLNSPETPIYSKGRTLYGLHLSKTGIRKLGYAVLVEGYFDFAQVFQSQAAPAVASCGTALTSQQAQLLHRFTPKVVLSFDPDAAGQGVAIRSCELLVAEGFDVNVLALDKGEDPDTFIRRQGGEQYRERLRNSRPYLEFLLDQASIGLDFGHDEQRRQFLGKMLGVAAKIPEAAARDQFADRIAHKARVTEDVVRAEIRKAAVQKRTELTPRELPAFGHLKDAEKGLIWGLIHNTSEALKALADLDGDDLCSLAARDVFEAARALRETPADRLPSALIQRLSTVDAQLVSTIASEPAPPANPAPPCGSAQNCK